MKINFLFIILIIIAGLISHGCDSPGDSKATSVAAPILVSPNDGDTTVSKTPVFNWTNDADKLEIDENAAFSSPFSYAVSGTQFTYPGQLVGGIWYYWRAGVTSGTTVYWSESIYHFRTVQ
jgi:hypothetical protein